MEAYVQCPILGAPIPKLPGLSESKRPIWPVKEESAGGSPFFDGIRDVLPDFQETQRGKTPYRKKAHGKPAGDRSDSHPRVTFF